LGEREAARFRHVFTGADRPTALACSFDLRAAEALLLLRDMGLRCPDDVAVVGLGDSDLAPMLTPPLTTFRFDLAGLAHAAATMLDDLLAGRPVASREVTGRLVARQSCGAYLAHDSALAARL
jgi:DNA-binding LacI/PurR family transcriptional regulator